MKRELAGYLKQTAGTDVAVTRDIPLIDGNCAWVASGRQCCFPGAMTESTLGTDRWYCRFHFKCTDGAIGAEIVRQSQSYTPDRYDEMYAPKKEVIA